MFETRATLLMCFSCMLDILPPVSHLQTSGYVGVSVDVFCYTTCVYPYCPTAFKTHSVTTPKWLSDGYHVISTACIYVHNAYPRCTYTRTTARRSKHVLQLPPNIRPPPSRLSDVFVPVFIFEWPFKKCQRVVQRLTEGTERSRDHPSRVIQTSEPWRRRG